MCPLARGQTHRQTDTKVTTEYTLLGLRISFLQPTIKERSKKRRKQAKGRAATETEVRKLIDLLLHSLDTFLVDQIHAFDRNFVSINCLAVTFG